MSKDAKKDTVVFVSTKLIWIKNEVKSACIFCIGFLCFACCGAAIANNVSSWFVLASSLLGSFVFGSWSDRKYNQGYLDGVKSWATSSTGKDYTLTVTRQNKAEANPNE